MSSYQLAVNLSLSAGGLMSGAAMAMGSFNSIKQAAAAADASVLSHQRTLDRMNYMGASQGSKTYQYALQQQGQAATAVALAHDKLARAQRGVNQVVTGAAVTAVVFLGLDLIKGWVKDASDLQDALAKVSLATTGTSAQLAALQSQAYTVAGQTQYSAPQIMAMEATMGRMAINRRDWVAQDIPTIARAAEIDQRMAGISPESSVPAMISQAHMLGATHGKAFIDNIALGTRALLASGMTPDQQNNALKYVNPARSALGLSTADAFEVISLANITGLTQGKGASNLGALFRQILPVGTAKHKQYLEEIERLGGGQYFNHGKFVGWEHFQQITARGLANETSPEARAIANYYAFGVQGSQAVSDLTSPSAMANSDMLRHKLAPYDPIKNPTGIATVEEMQLKLNQTMVGQTNTLNTNLHSLSAMLGGELVPSLTKAASAFVQLTGGIISFGQQHPLLIKMVAVTAAIATAAALIGGPILIIAGAFNVLAAAGGGVMAALGLGAGGAGLAAGLAGIAAAAWPIVAVGAAIAGVVLLVTHWNDVTRFMGEFAGGLVTAFSPLVQVFHSLGDLLGPLVRFGADLVGQLFSPIGSAAHSAALEIEHLLRVLNSMRVHPATTGTGTGLHPLPPLVRNLPDPRVPGSTVTTLLPTFTSALRPRDYARLLPNLGSSQMLSPGTVGLPSGSLGFKPFVAPHSSPRVAPPPSGRGGGYGIGTQTVNNHYSVTINTTSDQHARDVAREAVRELQRHESARMRDLHRYGSLTPSGVELGFHGS